MELTQNEITQTFLAQLFNPKRIIRETSYYKMAIVDSDLRNGILNRFSEDEKFKLTKEISTITENKNGLMILSLLKLKQVINNNSFRPMNWVSDIPHIESQIVDINNDVILKENAINYLLRETHENQSCNIVNNQYSGLKLNDRVISINKTVFNKIASHSLLTNFLLSDN
jgi:hypothetical protein